VTLIAPRWWSFPWTSYEGVRGEGEYFIVVASHEDPTLERAIKQVGGAVVVEKRGEGGDVARDLDPRS
jgi:hypothetical protein